MMNSLRTLEKTPSINNAINTAASRKRPSNIVVSSGKADKAHSGQNSCKIDPAASCCFFCVMKESDASIRRAQITSYLKKLPFLDDDQELILVVSGIWNMAMAKPVDVDHYQELPFLGIFECMAALINKAITKGRVWLFRNHNIYIPYYAAHIIGSYTINDAALAKKSVASGVIPPLLELLRGKMSWVEQRVAVRALGHLASYDETFQDLAAYDEELVRLTMQLASTCLEKVFNMFVGVKDNDKGTQRMRYQCNLLTRGNNGGFEKENMKAEEWASQLQCWCLHLLSCFAVKKRCLDLLCREDFLKDLSEMWGGLANHTSPAGVGLIRILCYSKEGRISIAESRYVIEHLCNLSRSSDDWQYMGIDCLLLLLNDSDTRHKVVEVAALFLVDLVELRNLGGRSHVGDKIARRLTHDFKQRKTKIKNSSAGRALEEIWALKALRRKKEQNLSHEKAEELKLLVNLIKHQGNCSFCVGDVEDAVLKYSKALELCPLKFRKERLVLYSNRAQCNLLLKEADAAIGDATRALCLANPPNSHAKSLWRRSQAYDMKGLAKESLMDCVMFISCWFRSESTKGAKIPYHALTMINKQMHSTWLFRSAQLKQQVTLGNHSEREKETIFDEDKDNMKMEKSGRSKDIMRYLMQNKQLLESLSRIQAEHQFDGDDDRSNIRAKVRKDYICYERKQSKKSAARCPSLHL